MSFHLTDLHTMIVSTHEVRNIAIGKVMRVALLAAAEGKFALRDHRGSKLILTQNNRDSLEVLATEAEQQSRHRWWTKPPWTDSLRCVFVDEEEFFSSLNNDASSTLPANKNWIVAEAKRLQAVGEVNEVTRITDFAKQLEKQMRETAKSDNSIRPVGWKPIKNMLRTWGLWPITPPAAPQVTKPEVTATPMTEPAATAQLQMAEPGTATRIVEDEPTPRVRLVIQALDAQDKVFHSLPAQEQLGRIRNWVTSQSGSSKTTVSERTLGAAKAYRRKHPKQ
jgi:hypothetical protein